MIFGKLQKAAQMWLPWYMGMVKDPFSFLFQTQNVIGILTKQLKTLSISEKNYKNSIKHLP